MLSLRKIPASKQRGENEKQFDRDSDSSETIKFHWKISGESGYDYLRFYIDGVLQDSITDEQDWQQKSYNVSSGIHTFKWAFSQGGSDGDHAWLDFVQWSGPSAAQDPANFQTINYKHDVYGRRIEKKVNGFSTRYLYACGEPVESNGPQHERSLDCARDACARTASPAC
jgi:hypothetical protein